MSDSEATAVFRKKCSLCDGTMLDSCLKLPDTPLANDFTKNKEEVDDLFPLELLMCADCRHVQTSVVVLPEKLFRNYVYATSTSRLTLEHLAEQARVVLSLFINGFPAILEVGSNDGALGKELVKLGLPPELYVGIEPSSTMAKEAQEAGVNTINRFFGKDLAKEMIFGANDGSMVFGKDGHTWQDIWNENPKPEAIVANNVFAHVPSVKEMFEAVKILLDEFGVFVMDVAWAADIFVGSAFDTIYHEHMSYHTLAPLMKALEATGMFVTDVDVMPNQVGRGSLRIFASPEGTTRKHELQKIGRVLLEEKRLGLHLLTPWKVLEAQISAVGERLRYYLNECQAAGKVVWGYGAPAKLTTLLYACRVESGKIAVIVDDSPWKQGLYTPGMKIPVVASSEIYDKSPDVVVVFAWNFADDIVKKLRVGGYRGEIYRPLPIEKIWPVVCGRL